MAEQPVFDLVPLAGTRREVAHRYLQPCGIGHALQRHLPQPCARTVAAASIGGDQQLGCPGTRFAPHSAPPTPDRFDRELRRVLVDTHPHPSRLVRPVAPPPRTPPPSLPSS